MAINWDALEKKYGGPSSNPIPSKIPTIKKDDTKSKSDKKSATTHKVTGKKPLTKRTSNNRTMFVPKEVEEKEKRAIVGPASLNVIDWNNDGKTQAVNLTLRGGKKKATIGGEGFDESSKYIDPATGQTVTNPLDRTDWTLKDAEFMTEEEKSFIRKTFPNAPTKAMQYYLEIYPTLESRKAQGKGFWERNLASGAIKFSVGGMLSTVSLWNEAMGGERSEQFDALIGGEKGYQEGASKKNEEGGKGTKFAGDIVQGFAQFIPQVIMSRINPMLGLTSIALPSIGSYSEEAKLDGASVTERLIYGTLGGTGEAFLQKFLFIDKLLLNTIGKGAINGVVINGVLNMAKSKATLVKQIGQNALGEGAEEALIDPFTGLISKLTYDKEKAIWGDGGVVDPMQMAYDGLLGAIVGGGISAGGQALMLPKLKQAKATIDTNYPQALVLAYALPDTTVPVEAGSENIVDGEVMSEKVWGKKDPVVTDEPKYKSRTIAESYRAEDKQVSAKEVFDFMNQVEADYVEYNKVMNQKYNKNFPEHVLAVQNIKDIDKKMPKVIAKIQSETTQEEGMLVLKEYKKSLEKLAVMNGLPPTVVAKIEKSITTIDSTLEQFGELGVGGAEVIESKRKKFDTESVNEEPVKEEPAKADKTDTEVAMDRILSDGYVPSEDDGISPENIQWYKEAKRFNLIPMIDKAFADKKDIHSIIKMIQSETKNINGAKFGKTEATFIVDAYNSFKNNIDKIAKSDGIQAEILSNKKPVEPTKVETKKERRERLLKGKKGIGSINKSALKDMNGKSVPDATFLLYDLQGNLVNKYDENGKEVGVAENYASKNFAEVIKLIKEVPWFKGVTFEFHDDIHYEYKTVEEINGDGYIKESKDAKPKSKKSKSKSKEKIKCRVFGKRSFDDYGGRIQIFQGATNETVLEELIHQLQYNFATINPEMEEAIQIWNQNYTNALIADGYDPSEINQNTLIEGFAEAVIVSHMGWAKESSKWASDWAIDSSAVVTIKELIGDKLFNELTGENFGVAEDRTDISFTEIVQAGIDAEVLKVKDKIDKGKDENLSMIIVKADVHKNASIVWEQNLYVHAPDGVNSFEEALPYHDIVDLEEAKAITSNPERLQDFKDKVVMGLELQKDIQRKVKNKKTNEVKEVTNTINPNLLISWGQIAKTIEDSKTEGTVEVKLTKGCGRTSTIAERILFGLEKKDTELIACYGGTCFVNFKTNAVIQTNSWEDVNIQEMKFADASRFEKWFENPEYVKQLNDAILLRHGVAGCDSNTIATGLAYEWLKNCKKAGVTTKNVLISAGYAPVTNEQYQQLADFNDILNLHITVSPWFSRNEIMLRLAEFERARDNGLNPILRVVTNTDNVSGIDMASRYEMLKGMMFDLGIDQSHILETPFHDDRKKSDLPVEFQNQPKKLRSKPSGDFLNICCETGKCNSCKFQCMNNQNHNLSLIDYFNKPDTAYYENSDNMVGAGIKDTNLSLYSMVVANRSWEELPQGIAEYNKDSKVLDKYGNLAVMYHGTTTGYNGQKNPDFQMFHNNSHFGSVTQANIISNSEYAYANRVFPVYLNITNPYLGIDVGGGWDAEVRNAKSLGHDGIKYLNRWEGVYKKNTPNETGLMNGKELSIIEIDRIVEKSLGLTSVYDRTDITDEQFLEIFDAEYSYVAFKPEQIKIIWNEHPTNDPKTLYSMIPVSTFAPTFYSELEKQIDAKISQKMISPEDLLKFVTNISNPIRADEIKWSGIMTYLGDPKNQTNGKVSKVDLLEWLKNNRLDILDDFRVDKGLSAEKVKELDDRFDKVSNKIIEILAKDGTTSYEDWASIYAQVKESMNYPDMYGTAMEQYAFVWYQFDGFGHEFNLIRNIPQDLMVELIRVENQRNLVGTIVSSSDYEERKIAKTQFRNAYTVDKEQTKNYREFLFKVPSLSKPYFKEVHWNKTANVVAHVRTSDKIDADGNRVLFLEEVQSDLHEEAIESKGYDIPVEVDNLNFEVRREYSVSRLYVDGKSTSATISHSDARDNLLEDNVADDVNINILENYLINKYKKGQELFNSSKPPQAPFQTTWQEFALKKMLRVASEEGYTKIAWTTGEQQADFYGLEKDVSEIYWSRSTGNPSKYFIAVYDKDRNEMLHRDYVTIKDISAIVGNDIAKQIESSEKEYESIMGDDLKTGGTGMKNFYDIGGASSQNIPKFLNRYGKQWGAKVETTIINHVSGAMEQPSITITPQMKNSVLYDGQANYSLAPVTTKQYRASENFINEMEDRTPDPEVYADGTLKFYKPSKNPNLVVGDLQGYQDDEEVKAHADELIRDLVKSSENYSYSVYYGTEAKTIGSQVSFEMMHNGEIDLRNTTITSLDDLATISQIFRDPRYETFRYIYTKGDKIVGHQGVTSKVPAMTMMIKGDATGLDILDFNKMRDAFFIEVEGTMKSLKADGIYIMHNHPSGVSKPSREDEGVSINVARHFGNMYKGHMVIDSNEYSFIDTNGDISTNPLILGEDLLLKPSIAHPLGGFPITADNFATFGKQLSKSKNISTIVFADAKLRVRVLQEIHNDFLIDELGARKYIKEYMVKFGSPRVFISTNTLDPRIFSTLAKLVDSSHLTDALITTTDTTLRGKIVQKQQRGTPRGVNPEIGFGVNENIDKPNYSYKPVVTFTEQRFELLKEKYSAPSNGNYARASVAMISPEDYLSLTTTDGFLEEIESETDVLNKTQLRKESQEIFLFVDFATGRVTGHEGRHRMVALRNAGYGEVAITVTDFKDDKYNMQKRENVKLIGQEVGEDYYENPVYAKGNAVLKEVIPISVNYWNEIADKYVSAEKDRPATGFNYSMMPVQTKTRSFGPTFGKGNLTPNAEKALMKQIKDGTYGYDVYHNDALMADAREYMMLHSKKLPNGGRDYSEIERYVLDQNTAPTNMMFAIAFLLQDHYLDRRFFFLEVGIAKALKINEAIATKATVAGQAIQALSLWSRLSPQGITRYATQMLTQSLTDADKAEIKEWSYNMEVDFNKLDEDAINELVDDGTLDAMVDELIKEIDPKKTEAKIIADILANAEKGDDISRMQDTIMEFAKERFPQKSFSEPWQYVVDAIKHRKEYKQVWGQMQSEIWKDLTEEQKNELIISKFFNYTPTSFVNESKLAKSVKNELAEMKTTVRKVVLDSLVNQEQYKEQLVNNLMTIAGLNATEAKMLENKLRKKYTAMTEAEKKKIAEKILKTKEQKEENSAEGRAIKRLIELSNIGALTTSDYQLAIAHLLGLSHADPDFMRYISAQAQILQGLQGRERIEMQAMIMEDIASKIDVPIGKKISALQTIAQLLNPVTFLRNFYGNTSFAFVEYIAETLNIPFDMMASALGRTGIANTYLGRQMGWNGQRTTLGIDNTQNGLYKLMPIHRATMMWLNFGVGFKEAKREIDMGINTQNVKENKFDIPQQRIWHEGVMAEVEKLLALELRAFDRASYLSTFSTSIYEQMTLTGASEPTPQMIKDAHFLGMYRTFQDDNLVSTLFVGAKRLANVVGISPKNGKSGIFGTKWFGLGDATLKYPKTPANLLARSIDYSPIGLVGTFTRLMLDNNMSPYLRQKTGTLGITRGLLGSAVWFLGMVLYSAGVITGSPDDDEDQGIMLLKKAQNISSYQINWSALGRWLDSGGFFGGEKQEWQDGDNLDTYNWLLPLGLSIAIGANIQRSLDKGDTTNLADEIIVGLKESVDSFLQQPMMQGINTLFGVGAYGEDANIGSGFVTTLMGIPASFYPTVLARGKQTVDNRALATWNPQSDWQTTVNRLQAKTPLVNGLETPIGDLQAVEPYTTPFGEVSTYWKEEDKQGVIGWGKRIFDAFGNPSYSAKVDTTPLVGWTMSLYDLSPNRGAELAPTTKSKWVYDFVGKDDEPISVVLTQKENREMNEFRGKRMAEEYSKLMETYGEPTTQAEADKIIDKITTIKSAIGREVREEVVRMRAIEEK